MILERFFKERQTLKPKTVVAMTLLPVQAKMVLASFA